jgi:D-3-phosphoglycerate dehydrogenase
MPRILLTTTSFQDTPGQHHTELEQAGFEIVRDRGPLSEQRLLELIDEHGGFDAFLNGDDKITARVIDAALAAETPLRVISKYGIGLDSIDVAHATEKRIPVLFTPGVNETTVAEHAIGLMIALGKRFHPHLDATKNGQWKRKTGKELRDQTLGIVGLGRIGRAVAERAHPFGMTLVGYDPYWPDEFAAQYGVQRADSIDALVGESDIVTLHTNAAPDNRHLIDQTRLDRMKEGAMLINTARGTLVDENAVAAACESGHLWGYATDVLETEPMQTPHPFQKLDNVMVTPHIASRTFGSIQRQGSRAVRNLVNYLAGESDYIQANKW